MISLIPVKLDLALDQAMDFSKVVWNFRYANGTPIDLSNTTGSCFFMKTYPIWQGYNEDVYTLNASADSSGNLKLSSNAAYMSNISACNYLDIRRGHKARIGGPVDRCGYRLRDSWGRVPA